MLRKAIIVSPYFPPASLAGVHRARHLVKHLPALGWHPILLCVHERYYQHELDPALASLVPSDAEIVKVAALAERATRRVGIGDISLRAFQSLRRALFKLLRANSIDIVLITGSPFYSMLLTSEIKRKFAVPVVLDFQDPWVSHWGAEQAILSKAGLSHTLSCWLEPRAIRHASFVTSVSATHNAQMAMRYPTLDESRMAAIPIGGDPEDFHQLQRTSVAPPDNALDPQRVNLSFVGTVMPRSSPLIRLMIQGLKRLRQLEPELASRIRLNFVGTSNQPGRWKEHTVLPIACEVGMSDAVHEIPQRLPFMQALSVLARSDGVLLIGSDEVHYTASKIYPALMSDRPFLSLFHEASSSHSILTKAGGGLAHAFVPGDDPDYVIREIAESLRVFAINPLRIGKVDRRVYAPYEAKAIAGRFAGVFEHLSVDRGHCPVAGNA